MTLQEIHERNGRVEGAILKFRADRLPVAFILTLFCTQLLAWWLLPHGLAVVAGLCFLPLLGSVAIYNHHQQHHGAFNSRLMNRLFELVLGIQTMIPSYAWVLHHNYGHHPNYMNQPPCQPGEFEDESRWARRDGSVMGPIEYTLNLLMRAPGDGLRAGRRQPRVLRYFLLMWLPYAGVQLVLAWFDIWNFVAIFFVPAFCMLLYVYYLTHEHHSGLYGKDPYAASRNRVGRFYNLRTCNLGYHTAHHLKPYIHWSLLPAYHRLIEDKIPPRCFVACR
jgi:beta-carotene hydroxylase